jgi:hypothetical protein
MLVCSSFRSKQVRRKQQKCESNHSTHGASKILSGDLGMNREARFFLAHKEGDGDDGEPETGEARDEARL